MEKVLDFIRRNSNVTVVVSMDGLTICQHEMEILDYNYDDDCVAISDCDNHECYIRNSNDVSEDEMGLCVNYDNGMSVYLIG